MKRCFSVATMAAILVAGLLAASVGSSLAASPPNPLTFVTSIPLTGSRAHDLILETGRRCGASPCDVAYVATDVGLSVVDITQRNAPKEIGKVSLGERSFGLARQGDLIFMANTTRASGSSTCPSRRRRWWWGP